MRSGWLFRTVRRLKARLRPFVGMRDSVLVVGAGLYALGYLVWSLYAWVQGLGLLPVLSAQYIVAGATIGVFLLLAWALTSGLWRARARLHAWTETPTELRLTIRW